MKINQDLLLLLKSSMIGDSEPDLGEKLMKSFLSVLWESGTMPARIICLNSGIFLTTENSPVADILQKFADAGCRIHSCITCLEYYNRTDKLVIGQTGNMKETVAAMLQYRKILSP